MHTTVDAAAIVCAAVAADVAETGDSILESSFAIRKNMLCCCCCGGSSSSHRYTFDWITDLEPCRFQLCRLYPMLHLNNDRVKPSRCSEVLTAVRYASFRYRFGLAHWDLPVCGVRWWRIG